MGKPREGSQSVAEALRTWMALMFWADCGEKNVPLEGRKRGKAPVRMEVGEDICAVTDTILLGLGYRILPPSPSPSFFIGIHGRIGALAGSIALHLPFPTSPLFRSFKFNLKKMDALFGWTSFSPKTNLSNSHFPLNFPNTHFPPFNSTQFSFLLFSKRNALPVARRSHRFGCIK